MKIGNYPPSGGPGTQYLALDCPVPVWVNVAGIWRPIIDGAYIGVAPGDIGLWPYDIVGWDGHGMLNSPTPGIPRWTIPSGQSLAVHARARDFGAGIGSHVDVVLLHEHDTVGGANTGQDYGVGLFIGETATLKAAALAPTYIGGSPNRTELLTCANYNTSNWGVSVTPYTEIAEGVRREELYLDHLETLLTKTVAFAEASQQKNQDLIIGWEKAQSEATERQLATQTMVNEEERKNIMVQWAMESIPQMFTAGKATKKLLDLARTLTDQQIGAMSILLSEEQMVAIREVVKAARGNQPEQPANEAEKKEAQ